jgi:anti-sigma B factor antagonist
MATLDFRELGDEEFDITSSFDRELFAIELFGELDLASAPELEALIARAEETSATTILIDLSALRFIDSSGIGVLMRASEHSLSNGDRLRFLRATGQVERVLALCGLDHLLRFLD